MAIYTHVSIACDVCDARERVHDGRLPLAWSEHTVMTPAGPRNSQICPKPHCLLTWAQRQVGVFTN